MPSLRQSIVDDFWQKRDPRTARVLGWMESMEDWMLDDSEDVAESVYVLANTLERVSKQDVADNAEDIIKLMAYLSSSRAMRLMEWFDEHFSKGVSVELAQTAADMAGDETAEILLDRLTTLNRLHLLVNMFSPARTRQIADILQRHAAELN